MYLQTPPTPVHECYYSILQPIPCIFPILCAAVCMSLTIFLWRMTMSDSIPRDALPWSPTVMPFISLLCVRRDFVRPHHFLVDAGILRDALVTTRTLCLFYSYVFVRRCPTLGFALGSPRTHLPFVAPIELHCLYTITVHFRY